MDSEDENTGSPSVVCAVLAVVFLAAVVEGVFITSPASVSAVNNTTEAAKINITNITADYGTVSKNTFINEQGELIMPWQNSTPDNIICN